MTDDRRDWHPRYRTLWEHCRDKPDAQEDHPWGDTVFKIRGKVFAFLGYPHTPSVTVKAMPDELEVLLGLPFIRPSGYNLGRYGWVTVSIEDDDALKLALDLVDDSYELIKSRRRSRPSAPKPEG